MLVLLLILSALLSGLVGLGVGFRAGSNASMLSSFVLQGVIASTRLQAMEDGRMDVLRNGLERQAAVGIQAVAELQQQRYYRWLAMIAFVEPFGLQPEFAEHLRRFQEKQSEPAQSAP
jgi:hypothetical protein